MIAWFQRCNPRTSFIDYPGGLVPIHSRDFTTPSTVHENDITVADGAGGNLDLDLASLWCIEIKRFDN
jgi:hypothetical protein